MEWDKGIEPDLQKCLFAPVATATDEWQRESSEG